MLTLLRNRTPPRGRASGPRLKPTDRVAAAARDGLVVLLDLGRGVYIGLDEVASCLWQGIEARCTVDELVARVTAEYDVDATTARADALGFVHELHRLRLVTYT